MVAVTIRILDCYLLPLLRLSAGRILQQRGLPGDRVTGSERGVFHDGSHLYYVFFNFQSTAVPSGHIPPPYHAYTKSRRERPTMEHNPAHSPCFLSIAYYIYLMNVWPPPLSQIVFPSRSPASNTTASCPIPYYLPLNFIPSSHLAALYRDKIGRLGSRNNYLYHGPSSLKQNPGQSEARSSYVSRAIGETCPPSAR